MDELRKHFKPEFLNRVDDIVVFRPLGDEQLTHIVDLRLKDLQKLLADRKITLELTDGARKAIFKAGYDRAYGARPLKRAIQRLVQDQAGGEDPGWQRAAWRPCGGDGWQERAGVQGEGAVLKGRPGTEDLARMPLRRALRDCVYGGIALVSDGLELLQDVGEAGAIDIRDILYREEERAAGKGSAGLRDGYSEEIRGCDAANDVAI